MTNIRLHQFLFAEPSVFLVKGFKMTDVTYPQGCKPLREDLGPDELIRRLKVQNYDLKKTHSIEMFLKPHLIQLISEFGAYAANDESR